MKTFTSNEAAKTVQGLENLIDEISIFLQDWANGPTAHSPGVRELKSSQCSESVMTAYSQGAVLAAVSIDQSRACIKTLDEPGQTFAPWTCVRAVLESSALAAWLLDPLIDVNTRVRRSFALRYEGLDQAVKFVRVAGNQADVDERIKRIDEVEKDALNLGYSRVLDKQGKKRIGIGQLMPSATALVKEVLDKEFEYRLYSAVAHGHQWALIHLGLRLMDQEEVESNDEASRMSEWSAVAQNTRILEQHLRPNDVVYLCVAAATSITKPFWFSCQLFGWDTERAKNLMEKSYSRLNIVEGRRFWRN